VSIVAIGEHGLHFGEYLIELIVIPGGANEFGDLTDEPGIIEEKGCVAESFAAPFTDLFDFQIGDSGQLGDALLPKFPLLIAKKNQLIMTLVATRMKKPMNRYQGF